MKKYSLFLLFAGLLGWLTYCQIGTFNQKPSPTALAMPGGENEENRELREAWERKQLADPATGQIPEGVGFLERAFARSLPKAAAQRGLGSWQSRGPWNYGGRSRSIVIDATDENRILAGGVSGGLWLSEDGGQSWTRRTPLNAHPGVVSIAQDTRPGKTNIWYYISGEFTGTSASGGNAFYLGDGMFKSTDGGLTWSTIDATDNGNQHTFSTNWQGGWRVATDPSADTSQQEVYVAAYNTIYRSTNGGTSWNSVRGGSVMPASYYTDVAVSPTGVVYATLSSEGAHKGIWRSTTGTGFIKILPPNFPGTYERIVIGINPNNENEVYFLAATPGFGHKSFFISSDDWSSLWKYTYISGDGSGSGGQWEDLSMNLPNTGTQFDRFSCQGGYDLVVKVQPGTSNVFIGGTSAYRSTDGFKTPGNTTQIGGYKIGTELPFFEIYPNQHPDQHDMTFLPSNPNVLFTASDGGLHRTDDCLAPSVSWNSLNRGYLTTQLYTAVFDKHAPGDNLLIGGFQDNGNFFVNSSNPTAPWRQTVNGDGAFGAIPEGKPFFILSIQQGKVVKCAIDAAGNVTAFRRFDPIGPKRGNYQFINPLVIDPKDENILYLPAGRRLYRQDDLAAIEMNGQWDSTAQGWTLFPDSLAGTPTSQFSAIAVSEGNPAHRVYLGSDNNKLYRIDNANTGMPSFQTLQSPLSTSTAYVSCIAIDPDNADRVTVVFSNYGVYSIFRSEDAGATWKKVSGNLEFNLNGTGNAPSVRWITMLPFPDGTRKYFCGTSIGLFSADTLVEHLDTQPGTQWALESPDLIGSSVVPFVDVRPSDGLVVAATHGLGMYSANFMPVSGNHEPAAAVELNVFPNPATRFANFTLSKADNEPIRLRLFNLKGELVRQTSWTGPQGRLELEDLPAGAYVYQILGQNWQKSGKLVK